jgi:hypothetical protein
MSDMHQEHGWVVNYVSGVGRVLLGRIMLQINSWQAHLRFRENLILVHLIISSGLVQDAVNVQASNSFSRDFVNIVAPAEIPPTSTITFRSVHLEGQINLMGNMAEVVEIAAVDVPRQNSKGLRQFLLL